MGKPKKVLARIVAVVDAEVLLDRDGNIEEVQDVSQVIEGTEILSTISVLTEH